MWIGLRTLETIWEPVAKLNENVPAVARTIVLEHNDDAKMREVVCQCSLSNDDWVI
jgi:hypothetical protein